jgi:hypothetical protein
MSDDNTQDAAEPSPASAGSHGEHGQAMFSERSSMAIAAERWCDQLGVSPVAFNVVTALFRLGLVQKPHPTLTDEERGVLLGVAEDASYRCADFTERVVRGLLERTQ